MNFVKSEIKGSHRMTNNGPSLAEIGAALALLPDEVVAARFREIGFVVGDAEASPLDHDLMSAADDQEDWWK